MDVLGLPKLQNVERKIESNTQAQALSLNKSSDSKKTSPNGFSKELEKSLDKNSPGNTSTDKVNVSGNAQVEKPKQEYSRNTKINPPKPEEAESKTEKKKVDTTQPDMSWMVQAQTAPVKMTSITGMIVDQTKNQPAIPESKLLDPKLEQKVSPEVLPILKFMKAMAENFKIAPEKIMQALQELPDQALMQKPQAAITHLLQKLEVQPRQFTKAQILFNQMVTDIESVEKNKANMVLENPSLAKTQEFSEARTDGKVDNLKEVKVLAQEVAPYQTVKPSAAAQVQNMMKSQQPQVTPSDVSQLRAQNVINGESASLQPNSKESLDVLMKNLNGFETDAPVQKPVKSMDIDSFVNQMAMERNKITAKSDEAMLSGGEEDLGSELMDADILGQLAEAPIDKNTNIQKLVENIINSNNPEVKQQNMQKITEQTQVLIQKGGGEMKIQLSPEGMGDVLLKVKVQDGQVGIQMTTDNHQAKKLIESSIADLKQGLTDQKLNLETIKVDVSEKMQDQFANQNSEFKREDAREFLSQFRQNNDGFRQSFFANPGARAYEAKTQASAPDIQPMEKRTNPSGRLHLVA